MTRDDIIRMAREAGIPIEIDWAGRPSTLVVKDGGTYLRDIQDLERFARLARAAGEQAERDRTARLVQDMQAELQTLSDRLAKQKPRIWVYRDNPGLTTMREPGNPDLWEPLGPIV